MKKIFIFGLIVLLFTTMIFAEENSNGETPDENLEQTEESVEDPGRDTLFINTGSVYRREDLMEVTDGITIIKGSNEIEAEWAYYYEDESRAEIFENVVLKHDRGEINSDNMVAYLTTDRYIFEDNVIMMQLLDDGDFTLEAPYLELLQEENTFEAKQGVVIDYKGRALKGNEVFYNGEEETLELINDVYIEEENGDWVRSERSIFYLDSGEFNAIGSVEMEIGL